MKLTGQLDFKISEEAYQEPKLYQFLQQIQRQQSITPMPAERYDQFLSDYRDYIEVEKPSFWKNMAYLFDYQFGYMYFRYFAWNFIGRQDDVQGKLENDHGNWLSGINFIDSAHLDSQKHLPSDVLNNKARNTYYFLPFL